MRVMNEILVAKSVVLSWYLSRVTEYNHVKVQ